jgi:hypothetical protein
VRKLSPAEVARLREVLARARLSRAPLAELGTAHDLAADAGLSGTAAELRWHVRRVVAEPAPSPARDVLAGVVSGIITHHLLR